MTDPIKRAREILTQTWLTDPSRRKEVALAALDYIEAQQNLILRSSVKIDPADYERWVEAERKFKKVTGE